MNNQFAETASRNGDLISGVPPRSHPTSLHHHLSSTPLCSPESALKAAATAARADRFMERFSCVFDKKKYDAIARLQSSEMALGHKLGMGGFANVYEVRAFELENDDGGEAEQEVSSLLDSGDCLDEEERAAERHQRRVRIFLRNHCLRDESKESRYAVKILRKEIMQDSQKYRMGAADLVSSDPTRRYVFPHFSPTFLGFFETVCWKGEKTTLSSEGREKIKSCPWNILSQELSSGPDDSHFLSLGCTKQALKGKLI